MLNNCKILIAEDEAFIAADLAGAVEDAHGAVVGPCFTVSEGMHCLADGEVHAAILDVSLPDGEVTPLAIALLERELVVVFHTASAIPAAVIQRFGAALPLCRKPMESVHVVRHLARALGRLV